MGLKQYWPDSRQETYENRRSTLFQEFIQKVNERDRLIAQVESLKRRIKELDEKHEPEECWFKRVWSKITERA